MGARGVFDAQGVLQHVVLGEGTSFDRGLDGTWSRPRENPGEVQVVKTGHGDVVGPDNEKVIDTKTGDTIAYRQVKDDHGRRLSQPTVLLPDGVGGWKQTSAPVDVVSYEAWLAGANQAHDTARTMFDIAGRSDVSIPEPERLTHLGTEELKELLGGTPDDMRAALYEAVRRTKGVSLRWTQLAAGGAFERGDVVNMAAGEGKSYLFLMSNALEAAKLAKAGQGGAVHMHTTRDVLAEQLEPDFRAVMEPLGYAVHRLNSDHPPPPPKEGQPTVYLGTSQDAAFTLLKHGSVGGRGDDGAGGGSGPGFHAEIDEIDEALVYSHGHYILSEGTGADAAAAVADPIKGMREFLSDKLASGELTEADFGREPDTVGGPAQLTQVGVAKATALLNPHGELAPAQVEGQLGKLNMAGAAHWEYVENVHYVIDDKTGKLYIIDQTTHQVLYDPRTSSESRWNGGLAQALEAKHGLAVRHDSDGDKKVTSHGLYEKYAQVVGASGTANGKNELFAKQGLSSQIADISRYYRSGLSTHDIEVSANLKDKLATIAGDVAQMQELGDTARPQLILAHRNDLVAQISAQLGQRNVAHVAIDAKWFLRQGVDRDEAFKEVVAQAGKPGAVLVINMQGARGVDIPLDDHAKALGGLHVVVTGHSGVSKDIDIQAENRAARSGDRGSVKYYISPDDDLFRLSDNPQVQLAVIQYRTALHTGTDTTPAQQGLRDAVPLSQNDAALRMGIRQGPPSRAPPTHTAPTDSHHPGDHRAPDHPPPPAATGSGAGRDRGGLSGTVSQGSTSDIRASEIAHGSHRGPGHAMPHSDHEPLPHGDESVATGGRPSRSGSDHRFVQGFHGAGPGIHTPDELADVIDRIAGPGRVVPQADDPRNDPLACTVLLGEAVRALYPDRLGGLPATGRTLDDSVLGGRAVSRLIGGAEPAPVSSWQELNRRLDQAAGRQGTATALVLVQHANAMGHAVGAHRFADGQVAYFDLHAAPGQRVSVGKPPGLSLTRALAVILGGAGHEVPQPRPHRSSTADAPEALIDPVGDPRYGRGGIEAEYHGGHLKLPAELLGDTEGWEKDAAALRRRVLATHQGHGLKVVVGFNESSDPILQFVTDRPMAVLKQDGKAGSGHSLQALQKKLTQLDGMAAGASGAGGARAVALAEILPASEGWALEDWVLESPGAAAEYQPVQSPSPAGSSSVRPIQEVPLEAVENFMNRITGRIYPDKRRDVYPDKERDPRSTQNLQLHKDGQSFAAEVTKLFGDAARSGQVESGDQAIAKDLSGLTGAMWLAYVHVAALAQAALHPETKAAQDFSAVTLRRPGLQDVRNMLSPRVQDFLNDNAEAIRTQFETRFLATSPHFSETYNTQLLLASKKYLTEVPAPSYEAPVSPLQAVRYASALESHERRQLRVGAYLDMMLLHQPEVTVSQEQALGVAPGHIALDDAATSTPTLELELRNDTQEWIPSKDLARRYQDLATITRKAADPWGSLAVVTSGLSRGLAAAAGSISSATTSVSASPGATSLKNLRPRFGSARPSPHSAGSPAEPVSGVGQEQAASQPAPGAGGQQPPSEPASIAPGRLRRTRRVRGPEVDSEDSDADYGAGPRAWKPAPDLLRRTRRVRGPEVDSEDSDADYGANPRAWELSRGDLTEESGEPVEGRGEIEPAELSSDVGHGSDSPPAVSSAVVDVSGAADAVDSRLVAAVSGLGAWDGVSADCVARVDGVLSYLMGGPVTAGVTLGGRGRVGMVASGEADVRPVDRLAGRLGGRFVAVDGVDGFSAGLGRGGVTAVWVARPGDPMHVVLVARDVNDGGLVLVETQPDRGGSFVGFADPSAAVTAAGRLEQMGGLPAALRGPLRVLVDDQGRLVQLDLRHSGRVEVVVGESPVNPGTGLVHAVLDPARTVSPGMAPKRGKASAVPVAASVSPVVHSWPADVQTKITQSLSGARFSDLTPLEGLTRDRFQLVTRVLDENPDFAVAFARRAAEIAVIVEKWPNVFDGLVAQISPRELAAVDLSYFVKPGDAAGIFDRFERDRGARGGFLDPDGLAALRALGPRWESLISPGRNYLTSYLRLVIASLPGLGEAIQKSGAPALMVRELVHSPGLLEMFRTIASNHVDEGGVWRVGPRWTVQQYDTLFGNGWLFEELRAHPVLAWAVVNLSGVLEAVAGDRTAIGQWVAVLDGHRGLVDVLLESPALSGRLAADLRLFEVAAGNAAVAALLSVDPRRFDTVSDEELVAALGAAADPEPPPPPVPVAALSPAVQAALAAHPGLRLAALGDWNHSGVQPQSVTATWKALTNPKRAGIVAVLAGLELHPHEYRHLLLGADHDLGPRALLEKNQHTWRNYFGVAGGEAGPAEGGWAGLQRIVPAMLRSKDLAKLLSPDSFGGRPGAAGGLLVDRAGTNEQLGEALQWSAGLRFQLSMHRGDGATSMVDTPKFLALLARDESIITMLPPDDEIIYQMLRQRPEFLDALTAHGNLLMRVIGKHPGLRDDVQIGDVIYSLDKVRPETLELLAKRPNLRLRANHWRRLLGAPEFFDYLGRDRVFAAVLDAHPGLLVQLASRPLPKPGSWDSTFGVVPMEAGLDLDQIPKAVIKDHWKHLRDVVIPTLGEPVLLDDGVEVGPGEAVLVDYLQASDDKRAGEILDGIATQQVADERRAAVGHIRATISQNKAIAGLIRDKPGLARAVLKTPDLIDFLTHSTELLDLLKGPDAGVVLQTMNDSPELFATLQNHAPLYRTYMTGCDQRYGLAERSELRRRLSTPISA